MVGGNWNPPTKSRAEIIRRVRSGGALFPRVFTLEKPRWSVTGRLVAIVHRLLCGLPLPKFGCFKHLSHLFDLRFFGIPGMVGIFGILGALNFAALLRVGAFDRPNNSLAIPPNEISNPTGRVLVYLRLPRRIPLPAPAPPNDGTGGAKGVPIIKGPMLGGEYVPDAGVVVGVDNGVIRDADESNPVALSGITVVSVAEVSNVLVVRSVAGSKYEEPGIAGVDSFDVVS